MMRLKPPVTPTDHSRAFKYTVYVQSLLADQVFKKTIELGLKGREECATLVLLGRRSWRNRSENEGGHARSSFWAAADRAAGQSFFVSM